MQPRSFVPAPADRRFQSDEHRVRAMAAAFAGDGSPLAPGLKHMSAADPEYIAFTCPAELLFEVANTVDGVTSNPLEWS